jgi:hypothetical protein
MSRSITTEDALRMMRKMANGSSGGGGGTSSGGYGFYSLEVDEDGNLWANYPDGDAAPPFEYDAETGNLYIEV